MSKKYVIEIKPEYEDSFKGLMILGAKDSNLFVDTLAVENLEELNSDYINEHYGDLQDTAYQQGLNEAWEAARKVALNTNDGGLSIEELDKIFDRYTLQQVLKEYTAKQTIEKLKTYEEQKDKIVVGDEVERYINGRLDGRAIFLAEDDDHWTCLFWTGCCYTTLAYPKSQFKRTGKHYDISGISEEMRT